MNKYFSTLILAIIVSCSGIKYCKKDKNYVKNIDTSKRYLIESESCISIIENYDLIESLVVINVFDRVSGEKVKEGTVFPNNAQKTNLLDGIAKIILNEGVYNIGIITHGYRHLPFSIKGLKVEKHKKIIVNCYLGSSIQ